MAEGSGELALVSIETDMNGQLPGGHPSQQQYPSPKQGKSTSGGPVTTVPLSAKERRMDCWSLGWLTKECACGSTGSLRRVLPTSCSTAVLWPMGLEGSACFVSTLRSCRARIALIISKVLSCGMGSRTCEVGLSAIVWTVVFCGAGRESDPMERTGGLMACAAIAGLPWAALSMTEAQRAPTKTMGMRSNRRGNVRAMIGTILVVDRVSRKIFDCSVLLAIGRWFEKTNN
jgi:hypothetical protein